MGNRKLGENKKPGRRCKTHALNRCSLSNYGVRPPVTGGGYLHPSTAAFLESEGWTATPIRSNMKRYLRPVDRGLHLGCPGWSTCLLHCTMRCLRWKEPIKVNSSPEVSSFPSWQTEVTLPSPNSIFLSRANLLLACMKVPRSQYKKTTRNKKLLGTSASLLVTSALLLGTRRY